jgi:hypothetical protein
MVRHDNETVKKITSAFTVAVQRGDHKARVCFTLKDTHANFVGAGFTPALRTSRDCETQTAS